MASGFIVLRDGRCLSVRHAIHDAVLQSLVAAIGEASPLGEWLATQVPRDADVDLGYAFVRAGSEEHVSGVLDTRELTEPNRKLFESAVRGAEAAAGPRAPVEDVAVALGRLREMLRQCDNGRPPLALSDWTDVVPPDGNRIGPGWTDGAA